MTSVPTTMSTSVVSGTSASATLLDIVPGPVTPSYMQVLEGMQPEEIRAHIDIVGAKQRQAWQQFQAFAKIAAEQATAQQQMLDIAASAAAVDALALPAGTLDSAGAGEAVAAAPLAGSPASIATPGGSASDVDWTAVPRTPSSPGADTFIPAPATPLLPGEVGPPAPCLSGLPTSPAALSAPSSRLSPY